MLPNILIFDRPNSSTVLEMNSTYIASKWKQTSKTAGGYWEASFDIKEPTLKLHEYYNHWIGKIIKAYSYGMTAWEGIITQLDLVQDGFNYRTTLNPKWWHNSVKVVYRCTLSDDAFYGSGLDDFLIGGAYSLNEDLTYTVQIDAEGTPDTFKWKDNKANYTSYDTWWDIQSGGSDNDEVSVQKTLQTIDDEDGELSEIMLYLRRIGSPGGNLNISVQSNSGGSPDAEITNGGSDTVACSDISTSGEWVSFTFSSPPTTRYIIQFYKLMGVIHTMEKP